nr:hypothetical protein Iba_chr14cCG0140 [Ipomoea batatas]
MIQFHRNLDVSNNSLSRVVGTNFAAGHRRHSQNNPLKSRGGLAGFRFLPCVVTHPSQNRLDYRNCRRRRHRSRNSRPDFHLRLSRQATESHRRNHKERSGKRKKLRLGIILRIPHGIQLAKVMDVFEDTETHRRRRRRLRRRIGNHRLRELRVAERANATNASGAENRRLKG